MSDRRHRHEPRWIFARFHLNGPLSRSRPLVECSFDHDALVGVGDDQLDAAQTPPSQLAQKLHPERLGLRGTDVHAQHFAPPIRIDADRDDDGHRNDTVIAAHFDVSVSSVACQSDLPNHVKLMRGVAAGDFVTTADVALTEKLQAVRVRREMEALAQDSADIADTAVDLAVPDN